jgi:hypothetical protein
MEDAHEVRYSIIDRRIRARTFLFLLCRGLLGEAEDGEVGMCEWKLWSGERFGMGCGVVC